MSNSYFQFKQFRIAQESCAMKVSTDGCIQGAWTPVNTVVKNILDIGTGTGLLGLMLAQRAPDAHIDAIELDKDAAEQAAENVASSPWADRMKVMQGDVLTYTLEKKYDLIICNPPFFNDSLLSDKASRNMARHTGSLSYEQLITAIENNLLPDGYASVMLPVPEHGLWEALLQEKGWVMFWKLIVFSKANAAPVRVVSLCSKNNTLPVTEETLIMRDEDGNYTDAFTTLMQRYYLHF